MGSPQGLMAFPGIEQIIGGSITRSHGIAPSVCTLQCAPQKSFPKLIGTLMISFGRVKIQFPDSQIDLSSATRDRGGMVVSLRIITRQWKWQFGSIDGLYNERTNSGFLIQKLEKSPRELAELLLKEMNEKSYDVSALPALPRPLIDWVAASPANELARLGDSLGCRVIVDLKNRVKLVELGRGSGLPDGDVMSEGVGINPASRPDILRLVSGPNVYQSMWLLEAVGEENDDAGTLKPIDELSYKPTGGWGKESPQGFWGVAPGESRDIKEKCRQLALKTVYRLYRIKYQYDGSLDIPGEPDVKVEDVKQIVLLPTQIVRAPLKSEDDPIRFKPAQITGEYYPESWSIANTDLGSVYDGQFSIDANPRRQLVEFSKPVFRYKSVPDNAADPEGTRHVEFAAADLRLTTSYHVKDKDTRQLIRSTKDVRLTSNTSGSPLVLPVLYDDVFKSKRSEYSAVRQFEVDKLTGQTILKTKYIILKKVVENTTEFDEKSGYYLTARAKQFEDLVSGEREYAGIRDDIDLNGVIQQITYTVGRSGATTKASVNSEHDYDIPTYDERRANELFVNRFGGK